MRLRRIFQDYFTFSRKERNGIIVLLTITLILIIVNQTLFLFESTTEIYVDEFLKEVKRLEGLKEQPQNQSLFVFDPNSIDSISLDSLQIPKVVKSNLIRYRNKGGRFKYKTDFKKLYGMNDSLFKLVAAYIEIESKSSSENLLVKKMPDESKIRFTKFDANNCSDELLLSFGLSKKQLGTYRKFQHSLGGFSSKMQLSKLYGIQSDLKDSLIQYAIIQTQNINVEKTKLQFELNSVSEDDLKKIKGIGEVLSKRIIKYRNLLGGYYSVEQLYEVYGISLDLYESIKKNFYVDISLINFIDINFSSKGDLLRHPYVNAQVADEIIRYRSAHGKITNIDDLLTKIILNNPNKARLKPYLKTKNQ